MKWRKKIFYTSCKNSSCSHFTTNWLGYCICVSNYVSIIVIKRMKYYGLKRCEIVGLLKCLDTSLTTPLLTRCISFMNTFMQQYFFIVNSTKPIKIIWYVQRNTPLWLTEYAISRIEKIIQSLNFIKYELSCIDIKLLFIALYLIT